MAYPTVNARHRRVTYHNSVQPVTPSIYEDALRGSTGVDPCVEWDHTPVSRNVGGAFLNLDSWVWVTDTKGAHWIPT